MRRPIPSRRRRGQQGFALLLVFLMAAVVAITLFLEIPRVAQDSERAKEQILIDRGEQYKRAIQLFVKKAGRYPNDLKELESFQNQRFLRHRYVDPMTGKDEWRLIHIANGILTDSKLTKPQQQGEEKKDNGTFAGTENTFGSGSQNGQSGGAVLAQRRRASDGSMAGFGPELPANAAGQTPQLIPGQQNLSGSGSPTQVQPIPGMTIQGQPGTDPQQAGAQAGATGGYIQPGIPGQIQSGIPGQMGTLPGQMGGIPGRTLYPGQQTSGTAGSSSAAASSGSNSFGSVSNSFGSATGTGSTQLQPGQASYSGSMLPGQPGAPVNSQYGGASPYSTNPAVLGGTSGIQQPGTTATSPNSAATDMINRILTTPRPGGMPNTGIVGGGMVMGGGIAGVASNGEGEGIMVYNDRTLFNEWEFVFDPQKVKQIPNPNATGAGGTPADRMSSPLGVGGAPGTGGMTSSSGGNSFGSGNSFGTTDPNAVGLTGNRATQPQNTQVPGR